MKSRITELAVRADTVATGPLTPAVRAAVAAHLLDTVGALLAGYPTVRDRLDPALDSLFGAGARRIAYAGGVCTYCWETSDVHRYTAICPGVVVLPACLAALELDPDLTWDRLHRAYLAGYEVALAAGTSIGSAALLPRGWWPTALVAPLGGAAALALLRRLSPARTASAIALAAQQAGGSVAGSTAAADGRLLQGGQAADRAVAAVLLAEAGWRGALDMLDDPRSPLCCREDFPDTGQPLLTEVSIKAHAGAQQLQGAADAVRALRGRAPNLTTDLEELVCRLPAQVTPVVDRPLPLPSALSALPSAQYVLAAVALHGACRPGSFAAEVAGDPALRAVADRIRVVPDDELTAAYPGQWGATVVARTGTGEYTESRTDSPGDPAAPLSIADLIDKFCASAAPVLGRPAARRWARAVLDPPLDRPPRELVEDVLPLLRDRRAAKEHS